MLLINSYRFAVISAYDPDAVDYISRVEAADGQALESGVKDAINALFVGCKADESGIAGVSNYQTFGSACLFAGPRTRAGCRVPLGNAMPAILEYGTAGGWSLDRKTGLAGNGIDNYLDTQYASASIAKDNCGAFAYVSIADLISSSGTYLSDRFSGTTSVDWTNIQVTTSNRLSFNNQNGTAQIQVAPSRVSTGFIGSSRIDSASYSARYGGVSYLQTRASAATRGSGTFHVFARPTTTVPGVFTIARLAAYNVGAALSMDSMETRLNDYMAALATAIP
jgi:hypothetical protein